MGYERYPRNTNPQGDYYNRSDRQDYGQDGGGGRDYSYSSARDYQAAGEAGGRSYGQRDYGNQRYAQRDARYGDRDEAGARYGQPREYHGSYASDGRRFEDVGRFAHADDDDARRFDRGGQPRGYDYQDRGFFQRAGDEVRSWFGDDEADRRREADQRYDQHYGNRHDSDYHSWRSGQIAALDRDYDEYRRENRTRFENEFSTWRAGRQGQRDSLSKVSEHQDVVGSDGEHVGTVDKVRGDRILLTKNDADAGGRHHSIPSSWIDTVDTKVTLRKTAAEAKQHWRDEERNQALFGDSDRGTGASAQAEGRVTGKAKAY